jgi:hypothetical protein
VSCKPPAPAHAFRLYVSRSGRRAVLGPSCVSPPRSSNANSLWRPELAEPRRVIIADANARLGADVGRYSFIVVDLHHLLLAGLPAHFESYMPSHAVGSL